MFTSIVTAAVAYVVGEFRPASKVVTTAVIKVKSWFTKQEASAVKVVNEVKAKV